MKHALKLRLLLALTLLLLAPAAWSQSQFGGALTFNGTNQYIVITNFGTIIPTNEITVEFWAYTSVAAGQSGFILNPDAGGNRLNGHVNYGSPPSVGELYWDFGNIGTAGRLGPVGAPMNSISNWVHYAFVASQSGNYMSIYTNGVLSATKSGMTPFVRGVYDLCIGGGPSGFYYHGTIDDFRVWKTARTQTDIQSDLAIPLTGSESNLLVYYRFDDTPGLVVANSAAATGSAFNGTLVNGPARVNSTVSTASLFTSTVLNNFDAGLGSLRQTVANALPWTTINFTSTLSGATIALHAEIPLSRSQTIDASALPAGIAINGGGSNRLFEVTAGSTNILTGLTLTNGNGGFQGGAIENAGSLVLNQCTIISNTVNAFGGGVFNSGTLMVNNSTFAGNTSTNLGGTGGGIENGGTLIVSQSTFTANSANGGGAIFSDNGSILAVRESTIVSNVAYCCGGGISLYTTTGTQILLDSIVAENSNADFYLGVGANFTVASNNFTGGDPHVGPLANNGGPTPTMALLSGSPAIDAGGALNEVQQITVGGTTPPSGTFTLNFAGSATTPLAAGASAATVQDALNALPPIGAVGAFASVTQAGSVYTVTFGGELAGFNLPQIGANGSGGATASVATISDGGPLPSFDQRGAGFPRIFNGTVDIGAFEASPDITAAGTNVNGTEGSPIVGAVVATFTNRLSNTAVASYVATIDWNDGTIGAGTITLANGQFTVIGDHTYANQGFYSIHVAITNTASAAPSVTVVSPAAIADPALLPAGSQPVIGTALAPTPLQTLVAFTDPGGEETLDHYDASISWGDSSPPSSGTISLSPDGAMYLVEGQHTYTAQGGYSISVIVNHDIAPPTVILTQASIGPPAPIAMITASFNPTVYGQPVIFTAALTPPTGGLPIPTGAVQFTIDGNNAGPAMPLDGFGRASFTNSLANSALVAGTHVIGVTYPGAPNYSPSSGSTTQTVNEADTFVNVSSSVNPSTGGQSVTFTAMVVAVIPGAGLPTGTVQFSIDGSAAGSPVTLDASGRATLTISTLPVAGSPHTVSAQYNGDGNFASHTGSLAGGQVVNCGVMLTVQNNNDNGPGSLRQAIFDACPGGTITFDAALSGSTIVLTNGGLLIGKSLNIDASALTGGLIIDGHHHDRVFYMFGGTTTVLTGLTITNGYFSGLGGGIFSAGKLSMNRCTVAGNTSAGNPAASGGLGGGISIYTNALTLNQCTVANNFAQDSGGGIFAYGGASLNAYQCTISANSAAGSVFGGGGGINNTASQVTLSNSIVAGNVAVENTDLFGTFTGANNFTNGNPQILPLGNYAGPTPTMLPEPGSPVIDAGSDSATNLFTTDQRGFSRLAGLHVDIGAVESEWAPTSPTVTTEAPTGVDLTHATLTGAAAANGALTTWYFQFGTSASYGTNTAPGSLSSNGVVTAALSGLAPATFYHYQLVASNSFGTALGGDVTFRTGGLTNIVTNTNDSGPGSLRNAVTFGNVNGDAVTFAANLSGATIELTSGELLLNNNLTIDASPLGSEPTISGNGNSRVFEIGNQATNVLTALNIINGVDTTGLGGGGIRNEGGLTLNQCTVAGNLGALGGGIRNEGSLIVNQSTLSGNTATTSNGGAINSLGVIVLNECTVAGNSAGGVGGGIREVGGVNHSFLSYCTISGNVSSNGGGGLDISIPGDVTISGCIIASNSASGGNITIGAAAELIDAGFNLTNGNPVLAPLGNYGGPTQTMPPLPGSPAIDAGSDAATNLFATDQRGLPRRFGLHVDIGAVELQVVAGPNPPLLAGLTRSGNGTFGFNFTNLSGVSFTVFASTNLALPLSTWSNLGPAIESPIGSGHFLFSDPQATNTTRRFYRVRSP